MKSDIFARLEESSNSNSSTSRSSENICSSSGGALKEMEREGNFDSYFLHKCPNLTVLCF